MKKYNKNLLQEIYRINELLGTQLISEGVVDDIVRHLGVEVGFVENFEEHRIVGSD